MDDDSAVRQSVRNAIRAGRLPAQFPQRSWAGKGSGRACCVCERPLHPDEIEYEFEFASAEGSCAGAADCRLHARCFEAWKLELAG